MCFFFSLMPATFWLIVGYFILFSATKAEGSVRKFGRFLAIWTFIIAVFFPLMGAYVTLAGLCPIEQMLQAAPFGETPKAKTPIN